ncbi:OmpA family protein [Glaciimonas sp. PAMC28666]|uniref:OmpA family protein n=1 Tax=Glaciimonas sp. PAMC28666 TaxID=2807626 RepID=UPI001F03F41C|nr:OmpA family protein [Glaciimonas sp. PAMC28666]
MNNFNSGYPTLIAMLATMPGLLLVLGVLNLAPTLTSILVTIILLSACSVLALWLLSLKKIRQSSAEILEALGAATTDLPRSLRTQLPLILVVGDGLAQLFLNGKGSQLAHISDGAIWVRVERSQDMCSLSLLLRQWRDGRGPDGIVLAIAPALHADLRALTQSLRLIRQAASDTGRMLGAPIPGYLALYQRLSSAQPTQDDRTPVWYGILSATLPDQLKKDTCAFEPVIRCMEAQAHRSQAQSAPYWRAAALSNLMGWTRNVVLTTLQDQQQPAVAWPLFGIAWTDCGPVAHTHSLWHQHLHEHTRLAPPPFLASNGRWPLPATFINALPQRTWISPHLRVLPYALTLIVIFAALAGWGAARNNRSLVMQTSANIARFNHIPVAHDAARRDALLTLTKDRNRLESYQRSGVPLHLSFGMYRGTVMLPVLNATIASYQPPAVLPTVVTLESMSLFASGEAQLKPGSTRVMVAALEMIKAHPNNRILVAGYTDNTGNSASNLRLSIARASAVRDWLTEASDMAPSRFAIQGYGESRPLADNQIGGGRARNRRVEITLVPDIQEKDVPQ